MQLLSAPAYLGVVCKSIFGHSTLLLYQETKSPPLFCECCLETIRYIVLQLTLFIGHRFNKLEEKREHKILEGSKNYHINHNMSPQDCRYSEYSRFLCKSNIYSSCFRERKQRERSRQLPLHHYCTDFLRFLIWCSAVAWTAGGIWPQSISLLREYLSFPLSNIHP